MVEGLGTSRSRVMIADQILLLSSIQPREGSSCAGRSAAIDAKSVCMSSASTNKQGSCWRYRISKFEKRKEDSSLQDWNGDST